MAAKTDAGLTYNATTNVLTAAGFVGALVGNVTGNVTGNVSGNAGTADVADIATLVTVGTTTDTTCSVALFESPGADYLGAKTDAGITYNASTNTLTLKGDIICYG
jgi:hypothetical protein